MITFVTSHHHDDDAMWRRVPVVKRRGFCIFKVNKVTTSRQLLEHSTLRKVCSTWHAIPKALKVGAELTNFSSAESQDRKGSRYERCATKCCRISATDLNVTFLPRCLNDVYCYESIVVLRAASIATCAQNVAADETPKLPLSGAFNTFPLHTRIDDSSSCLR